ncbi:hypothetical protein LXJ15735_27380 [Lacrimispora xylanolytica]
MIFTISDVIQLFSFLVALFIGIVSIKISIKTMSQNSKMIEESTRPILIIYSEYVDAYNLNLVVKNIGKSCGTIKSFQSNYDFLNSDSYAFDGGDHILDFITLTLPPEAEIKCMLCADTINRPVEFDIVYTSNINTYTDHVSINLKAGMNIPTLHT